MDSQFGFLRFTIAEFENWIAGISVVRTIKGIQEHHTWRPNYAAFTGSNHFALQKSMKNHHVSNNGWSDIGQNFTIFPDGMVMTGRSIEKAPACILGNNSGYVCIENLGDFDAGRDSMSPSQEESILRATAALAKRFGLTPVNVNTIVYHHWFDLNTGERKNGSGTTKSCPGTAFFGGNKVADCQAFFLPRVMTALNSGPAGPTPVPVSKYVCVNADALRVRTGPGRDFPVAEGQNSLEIGSILRVFAEDSGWFKVSNSKEKWVKGNRTFEVSRVLVNTDDTKCRFGPGTDFNIVTAYDTGEVLFVHEVSSGWSRVSMEQHWISSTLLNSSNI